MRHEQGTNLIGIRVITNANTWDYDIECRANRWNCPALRLFGFRSEDALYRAMQRQLKRRVR